MDVSHPDSAAAAPSAKGPRAETPALLVEGLCARALFEQALGGTGERRVYVPQTEVIISGPTGEILRKVVGPGEYSIGSGPKCDLPVRAEGVAAEHLQLSVHEHGLLIWDLGGGGTFINGELVTGATRLFPTQQVRFGTATLQTQRAKGGPEPDEALTPASQALREHWPAELLGSAKYEVGRVLAAGGMGLILNARDQAIQRTVAMKVMRHAGGLDDLRRFLGEAQLTGQLEHPSIVPIYEIGVDEHEQPFYTMKFVRGVTLQAALEKLREGDAETLEKYPLGALLTVFQKLCDGVAFAHAKGVLHRDLKPENIMLGEYGEVLVMDWGLAKVMTEGAETRPDALPRVLPPAARPADWMPTVSGTLVGTPHFMAPEQAGGASQPVDERTDLFALGGILYSILTLRPPLTGDSLEEILARARAGKIEPPLTFSSGTRRLRHLPGGRVPASLSAVAMKALAPAPGDRYGSVSELQREIAAYQGGFATSAERASWAKQLRLLISRHRGIVSTATAAALTLLGGGVWSIVNLTHERSRAEQGEAAAVVERNRAALGEASAVAQRTRAERGEASALLEQNRAQRGEQAALVARQRATEARQAADELLRYMQYDLRDTLLPAGQLKTLTEINDRILRYHREHPPEEAGEGVKMGAERDRATALELRGDIQLAQGKVTQALGTFHEAMEIRQKLADQRPKVANWQRDLAVSYNKVGDANIKLKKWNEALTLYNKALAIRERLAQSEPEDVDAQRALSASYLNVGAVHERMFKHTEALASYTSALEIRQLMVRKRPEDLPARHDLANALGRRGDILLAQQKKEEALQAYREGLGIDTELVQRVPENTGWQRSLAAFWTKVGELSLVARRPAEALPNFLRSQEILEQLTAKDPSNADWQEGLAKTYLVLGVAAEQQGDIDRTLECMRRAQKIREQLAAQAPENKQFWSALINIYGNLAGVARLHQRWPDSAAAFKALLETARSRLAQDDPGFGALNFFSQSALV